MGLHRCNYESRDEIILDLGWALTPTTGVLIRNSADSKSDTKNYPKPEETQGIDSFSEPPEGSSLAETLVSDFWTPEL